MLGNYNCDYSLEGNLPGDRQRSATKKERNKETKKDRSIDRKSVNKETAVNLRRRCAIAARRQKVAYSIPFVYRSAAHYSYVQGSNQDFMTKKGGQIAP